MRLILFSSHESWGDVWPHSVFPLPPIFYKPTVFSPTDSRRPWFVFSAPWIYGFSPLREVFSALNECSTSLLKSGVLVNLNISETIHYLFKTTHICNGMHFYNLKFASKQIAMTSWPCPLCPSASALVFAPFAIDSFNPRTNEVNAVKFTTYNAQVGELSEPTFWIELLNLNGVIEKGSLPGLHAFSTGLFSVLHLEGL